MVLKVVWIVDLVVIFVAGLLVLLSSPDVAAYEAQRDQFWAVAQAGTVIYFVCAYWELRRRKAFTKQALAEHRSQQAGGSPGAVRVTPTRGRRAQPR